MHNVAIILGTRPEAIKLLPVYLELSKESTFNVTLVSTGQHREMLKSVFDFFNTQPDIDLNLMTANQSLAAFSAVATKEIDNYLSEEDTDLVIVQGDTTTAMVSSLCAYYRKIKVAHVEAGLRTFDKYSPFPEEVNRRIVGLVADFHFAPTKTSYDQLKNEKCENVWEVGNTVIDSLLFCTKKVESNKKGYSQKFSHILNGDKNIIVTGHRRESFGDGFQEICSAIEQLAKKYTEYNFIYPVHLNPNVKEIVQTRLSSYDNIYLIDPLPYDELIFLMLNAKLILTDSGGIQEEAPSLNVPVIVMRNHTERPEGIEAGCSVLSGTNCSKIVSSFNEIIEDRDLYKKMANASNPYGDGKTSQRIVQSLKSVM